jgi:hypothetical protein
MASPPPTDVIEIAIADADATREIGISWRTGEDSSSAARTVFELAARPDAWLPER